MFKKILQQVKKYQYGFRNRKPYAFQRLFPAFQYLFLKRDLFDSFNVWRYPQVGEPWTLLVSRKNSKLSISILKHGTFFFFFFFLFFPSPLTLLFIGRHRFWKYEHALCELENCLIKLSREKYICGRVIGVKRVARFLVEFQVISG
jgi:hypothetical protein